LDRIHKINRIRRERAGGNLRWVATILDGTDGYGTSGELGILSANFTLAARSGQRALPLGGPIKAQSTGFAFETGVCLNRSINNGSKFQLLLGAFFCAGAVVLGAADQAVSASRIQVEKQEKRLVVRARVPGAAAWSELATYVMEPSLRPYLHPVYDASGRQVLTEDRPEDHPWQHGIFTGFHRVNGFNYWKEDEGRQRFVRLLNLQQKGETVGWKALVELVAPNGKVVLEEENHIVIHAPESADLYRIEFTLVLRAKGEAVQFGKFFVGGLSVRMPWDKANPRQTHLNSNRLRGRVGEQQRAAWCTVERPFQNAGGGTFGLAIFDHPRNANHPPAWRVDEQGLINPNVSGVTDWSLRAGEERKFRYKLLVYHGSAREDQLTAEFQRFSGTSETTAK
jgi:hypothetical protein